MKCVGIVLAREKLLGHQNPVSESTQIGIGNNHFRCQFDAEGLLNCHGDSFSLSLRPEAEVVWVTVVFVINNVVSVVLA